MSDTVSIYLFMLAWGLIGGYALRHMEDKDGRFWLMALWTTFFGGYTFFGHIWNALVLMVLLPLVIVLL